MVKAAGAYLMTGAMFMAHCSQQEGVTKVFGQCGHTNYALIDACHKLGIEYISFRHEQQARSTRPTPTFRVTHKLAVLNVHLSPGLTNALTGVASEAADGTPMHRDHGQYALISPRARGRTKGCGCTPMRRRATSTGRCATGFGALMTRSFCRCDAGR